MRANAMKHVSLAEARANIAELLDAVERGETVQISRDGDASEAPLAVEERRERARRAMEAIMEARKTAPRVTVEEILSWRDEGRKY
jgi:antitoxin (DNA-binding transcriptional repressor) of toxin-antitoxin stability system